MFARRHIYLLYGPPSQIECEIVGKMPKNTALATSSDAASKADLSVKPPKLRKVRFGHKVYSMKVLEQTRTLLGAPQLSDSLKLRQKKKVLEEKLDKISDLDDQILGLLDNEDAIAAEINESGEFRETVYEILLKIHDKLRKIEVTLGGSGAQNQTPVGQGGGGSFTKLPK